MFDFYLFDFKRIRTMQETYTIKCFELFYFSLLLGWLDTDI